MNEMHLSKRLARVGEFVPENGRLADIGSDHAYLPVALMLQEKITFAVAGEVVKGPYDSAVQQVQKNGLSEKITVRLANGLAAVEPQDHIDVVTICGMGGALITEILAQGTHQGQLIGSERLILQPNIGEKGLRQWLQAQQYQIIAEDILEENGKIYEIIVAEQVKEPVSYSEKELLLGPKLVTKKNAVFYKKWQRELKQRYTVQEQLKQAQQPPLAKLAQLQTEIQWLEEELADAT